MKVKAQSKNWPGVRTGGSLTSGEGGPSSGRVLTFLNPAGGPQHLKVGLSRGGDASGAAGNAILKPSVEETAWYPGVLEISISSIDQCVLVWGVSGWMLAR